MGVSNITREQLLADMVAALEPPPPPVGFTFTELWEHVKGKMSQSALREVIREKRKSGEWTRVRVDRKEIYFPVKEE